MDEKFIQSLRVIVFVPAKDAGSYIEKVQDHIPSFLGHYDRVLWISDPLKETGTERYRPLPGSNPAHGGSGQTINEPSVRLEFSLPHDQALCEELIEKVFAAHHPWDEPVIIIEEARIYNPAAGSAD